MEPGLLFDGVSKKFKRGELHDSLRDLIPNVVRRATKRVTDGAALEPREFWALEDVSFAVGPGEALGIIGANGAGKSTTLKILNRIIQPSRGVVEVRGRTGALIEISAGFHQDLTGRENVFLQGSIMGMRRAEILRKFDEIVEFAGIGEFIDTPVKRYSSGMNARLGFAIAAHLDPEVLIIDEVLAVGDLGFQDRAFGRIRDLVKSGIPVVIVSHQLDRVATLCSKSILLVKGRVAKAGSAAECIAEYVETTRAQATPIVHGDTPAHVDEVHLLTPVPVASGGWIRYRVSGSVNAGAAGRYDPCLMRIRSAQTGSMLYSITGQLCGLDCPGEGPFAFDVDLQMNLPPGLYALETGVFDTRRGGDENVGPVLYVQVEHGPEFMGQVQLHARMQPSPEFAGT